MMENNFGNSRPHSWRDSFGSHQQSSLLNSHVQRAVQDLFLSALRSQTDEFICVFDSDEQIDLFCNKMLKYWEEFENYEICKEILQLTDKLKNTWTSSPTYYKKEQEVLLKEWLKSSF